MGAQNSSYNFLGSRYWSAWRGVDRRPIAEWAEQNVFLQHSSRSKNFKLSLTPQLAAPLIAFQNPKVRVITIIAAVQSGKSTFVEVVVPWIIENDPGNLVWNWETDQKAKRMCDTRIMNVLKNCKSVFQLIPNDRRKQRAMSIIFPSMFLYVQGADSETNLQSDSYRYEFNEEIWHWPPGHLEQAKNRTDSYWNAKIVNVSTGGEKDDDSDMEYKSGTQMEWSCICPSCRVVSTLEFDNLKFEGRDLKGERSYQRAQETAHYVCSCGYVTRDNRYDRMKLYEGAHYVSKNPGAPEDHQSFNWNSLSVEWVPWGTLAVQWLKAVDVFRRGDDRLLKEFQQKRMGKAWDPSKHIVAEISEISKAPYSFQIVKKEKWDFRYSTNDVQKIGFWNITRDWKKNGHSRLVWAGKLATYDEIRQCQQSFNVNDFDTFLDCGYEMEEVLSQCARFGWVPVWGDKAKGFAHFNKNKKKPTIKIFSPANIIHRGDYNIKMYRFARPTVYDILTNLKSGKGLPWEVASDTPEFYDSQMSSWVKRMKKEAVTGREIPTWVQVKKDDHLWACEAMQIVAAEMDGLITLPDLTDTEEAEIQ